MISEQLKYCLPLLLMSFLPVSGCGDKEKSSGDGGFDGGSDTDTSTDAGTDTDTGTNADIDTVPCEEGATESGTGGTTWVTICSGTFDMGSTEYPKEQPIHSVTVSTFELTKTEVTVTQYGECVVAGACSKPATTKTCAKDYFGNWGATGHENDPVNCVNWSQAKAFCTWIGGRLPSESEWEYAASNGSAKNKYPWGDEKATCDYAVMDDFDGRGCGTERTWAVCSKTAGNTSHGLCDMAGNVTEWVQDLFHSDYTGAPSDGSAWEDSGSSRVLRGNDFNGSFNELRSANRESMSPIFKEYNYGIRCAR